MCQPYLEAPWAIPACEKQTKPNPFLWAARPARLPLLPTTRASGVAPGAVYIHTWCDRCDTKVLRNVCWMNTLTRRLNRARPTRTPSQAHRHLFAFLQLPRPDTPRHQAAAGQLVGRHPGTCCRLCSILSPAAPSPSAFPTDTWSSSGLPQPHGLPGGPASRLSLCSSLSEPESPIHTFQLRA